MNSIETKRGTSQKTININYVIFYDSIYPCTPWMNSISLFNEENYNIKVFQRKYFGYNYNEELTSIKFKVISSYNLRIFYQLFYQTARAFKIFEKIGLKKLSTFGSTLNYMYTSLMFIITMYTKFRSLKDKEIFIAGDPVSLLGSYLVAGKKHVLLYWPLELWVYKDLKLPEYKLFKKIEKKYHKYAAGTLEFGNLRREILAKENDIHVSSIQIIPNSPIGEPEPARNFYFNELFGIPAEKKIILYAGGIANFNGIPQLIDSLNKMPDNFALVLHSKQEIKKKNLEKLLEKIKPFNAYISSDPLPFDKINLIYSSCDVGLMLMMPDNDNWDTNYIYADWSPGKLFNYFKFGVPVITTNLKGYKELIEGNGAGKVVENIEQVFSKAEEIMLNENDYRQNSIKLFNKLKFEKYHNAFFEDIINKNYN